MAVPTSLRYHSNVWKDTAAMSFTVFYSITFGSVSVGIPRVAAFFLDYFAVEYAVSHRAWTASLCVYITMCDSLLRISAFYLLIHIILRTQFKFIPNMISFF